MTRQQNTVYLDRLIALREQYAHLSADDLAGTTPIADIPDDPFAPAATLVCSTCGDPILITDLGRICRQCRLEGKVA